MAFVAYAISNDKLWRIFPEVTALVLAYVAFCLGNFQALAAAQNQLAFLATLVQKYGQGEGLPCQTFQVFTVGEVGIFYWAVVVSLVGACLVLAWVRGRDQKLAARRAAPGPAPAAAPRPTLEFRSFLWWGRRGGRSKVQGRFRL